MTTTTDRLLASIAAHLQQQSAGGSEELEVAAQLVGEALRGGATPPSHSLLEIFIAGEAALSARAEAVAPSTATVAAPAAAALPTTSAPADAAASSSSSNGLLERFIGNLQQRGFFAGTVEGSPEYSQRYETARSQFVARFGHRLGGSDGAHEPPPDDAALAAAPSAEADAPPAASSGADAPAAAVEAPPTSLPELITYAQARLDADDFAGAVGASSSAMELDVQTEQLVQLLNLRATAHIRRRQFDAAISDAETVLALSPDGAAATSACIRLGMACEGLGQFADAVSRGYEPALALDPSSEVARDGKQIALQKLQKQPSRQPSRPDGASAAATSAGAGASSSSSASEAGGPAPMGGAQALDSDGMSQLFSFFNNPEVARMAESVAASFVSGDDCAVQEAQAAMGSLFGGIDVNAALGAVGMNAAGGGGEGSGPADAPGAAGGTASSGDPGAMADFTRLIDDPSFMTTLGDLATSLSAPQPPPAAGGSSKPPTAGASGAEPNGSSSQSGGATISNGKARAPRQD